MDIERTCKECNQTKPLKTGFHERKDKKEPGGYRSICKDCACIRARKSYEKNKESAKKRCALAGKERILERRKYVLNYLKEHPCVQCGENNPILLEFDHINPEEKDLSISRAVWNNWSMKRLDAEIAKCQILCVRCHRLKTAEQLGWYKFV